MGAWFNRFDAALDLLALIGLVSLAYHRYEGLEPIPLVLGAVIGFAMKQTQREWVVGICRSPFRWSGLLLAWLPLLGITNQLIDSPGGMTSFLAGVSLGGLACVGWRAVTR